MGRPANGGRMGTVGVGADAAGPAVEHSAGGAVSTAGWRLDRFGARWPVGMRLRVRARWPAKPSSAAGMRAIFRRFRHGCLLAALRFGFEVRNVESVQAAQLDGYVFID